MTRTGKCSFPTLAIEIRPAPQVILHAAGRSETPPTKLIEWHGPINSTSFARCVKHNPKKSCRWPKLTRTTQEGLILPPPITSALYSHIGVRLPQPPAFARNGVVIASPSCVQNRRQERVSPRLHAPAQVARSNTWDTSENQRAVLISIRLIFSGGSCTKHDPRSCEPRSATPRRGAGLFFHERHGGLAIASVVHFAQVIRPNPWKRGDGRDEESSNDRPSTFREGSRALSEPNHGDSFRSCEPAPLITRTGETRRDTETLGQEWPIGGRIRCLSGYERRTRREPAVNRPAASSCGYRR